MSNILNTWLIKNHIESGIINTHDLGDLYKEGIKSNDYY